MLHLVSGMHGMENDGVHARWSCFHHPQETHATRRTEDRSASAREVNSGIYVDLLQSEID